MEELSIDNIVDVDVDSFFEDNEEVEETEEKDKETQEETLQVTEVKDIDKFFEPESVGNERIDNKDGKDTSDTEDKETSPQPNFYSSVLDALVEEGIFPNLENKEVTDAESFAKVVDEYIHSQLDERQQRVEKALSWGIEDSEISKYERTLQYLDGITEDKINEENEQAEQLRKNLIYQDYYNRFGDKERAKREVQKSINNGTDKEDAITSLKSNKDYFDSQYKKLLETAEAEDKKAKEEVKMKSERLKSEILKADKVFGDIAVDTKMRQKIADNITKPAYKDKETGELYTALQKYEMDNPDEFLKTVGIIFTLTDGFKDFSGLFKDKIKKEASKGLKALERTLNNTSRDSSGNLKFVTKISENPEAFDSGNWDFDV